MLSPLDNILANWHPLQSLPQTTLLLPPSPSLTASSISPDISPLDAIRVVCNVPLLAPRPLPYHSPTFLQFDLPDTDEDLSHPPYTHRPAKRKRDIDDEPVPVQSQPKRRTPTHRRKSRFPHRSRDHSSATPSHRAGKTRPRS